MFSVLPILSSQFLPFHLSSLSLSPLPSLFSLHPSAVSAFSNLQPCAFFLPTLSFEGGFSAIVSSFHIPLSFWHPPPRPCDTVIKATGDSGQTGWLLQHSRQPEQQHCDDSSPLFRVCSSASWLSARAPSPAITKLLEMLKRVLSACLSCLGDCLSAIMAELPLMFWHHFLKLFRLLNALVVVTKEWATSPRASSHPYFLCCMLIVVSTEMSLEPKHHGPQADDAQTHFQTLSLTTSHCCWCPTYFKLSIFDVVFLLCTNLRGIFSSLTEPGS